MFAPLIDERSNKRGPPRLVRGPETLTVVAIKVFVK